MDDADGTKTIISSRNCTKSQQKGGIGIYHVLFWMNHIAVHDFSNPIDKNFEKNLRVIRSTYV